jgi:hypothetical protein
METVELRSSPSIDEPVGSRTRWRHVTICQCGTFETLPIEKGPLHHSKYTLNVMSAIRECLEKPLQPLAAEDSDKVKPEFD